jgi:hypothetical protein
MKSCLPDDIPSGAIVSLVNRSKFAFLNNRLRPPGLPAGQFPILMLLSQAQDFTQDTLVRHYHPDKGTIARAVKNLEDRGYIRRITDPPEPGGSPALPHKGGGASGPAPPGHQPGTGAPDQYRPPDGRGASAQGPDGRGGRDQLLRFCKKTDLRR